uniref:Uncharacterized protein n=1 Tax=Oryza meridionalis TaxID=40149 RepID=A0A0E0CT71_9ORYZ
MAETLSNVSNHQSVARRLLHLHIAQAAMELAVVVFSAIHARQRQQWQKLIVDGGKAGGTWVGIFQLDIEAGLSTMALYSTDSNKLPRARQEKLQFSTGET